jgi:putative flippase GtrA
VTFFRYLVIQVVAYLIDVSVFSVLLGLGPLAANICSKVAAGAFAFVLHRHFTFGVSETTSVHAQVVAYVILLIVNIPFTSALLYGLMLLVSNAIVAKVLADTAGVGLTYLLSKHVVFSQRAEKRLESPP